MSASPSILRSSAALEFENLALRHQIGVLQRSVAKRLKINLRRSPLALAIVKPETVLAGHRAGFRLFWTLKARRGNLDDPSFRARPEI